MFSFRNDLVFTTTSGVFPGIIGPLSFSPVLKSLSKSWFRLYLGWCRLRPYFCNCHWMIRVQTILYLTKWFIRGISHVYRQFRQWLLHAFLSRKIEILSRRITFMTSDLPGFIKCSEMYVNPENKLGNLSRHSWLYPAPSWITKESPDLKFWTPNQSKNKYFHIFLFTHNSS